MEQVKNDKQALEEPVAGYDLHRAVIETNEAIRRLAGIVERAVATAGKGGGVDNAQA